MKKSVFVLFLNFLFFQAFSQSEISFFQGSFSELKERATLTEKYFLVDFYTSWCGYCKKMDATTLKDEQVVAYIRKYLIAYKIDAEKGEGPELAQKYGVQGFPTILIFDKSGKLVGKIAGYQTAIPFLQSLEKYTHQENKEIPKIENYFSEKKNYYDDLYLSLEMKKSKEQLDYEQKASVFGQQRNYFELDELMYELEQKKVDYSSNVRLAFFKAQNNPQKMVLYINELIEKQQITNKELHYYCLFFVEKGAITPDVLRWINQVSREEESIETYDTKALIQYMLGDTHDAKETIEKIQKMAKKDKKELPKTTEVLMKLI